MSPLENSAYETLVAKIKILSDVAWDERCDHLVINEWLDQFTGKSNSTENDEKLQMLFLLSKFIYYGSAEIRELLRSLFRDQFKYRIVERVRKENGDTTDRKEINRKFNEELRTTRFLPVGNPSESGSHLLYFFRQENHLGKEHFLYAHEIFASVDFSKVRDLSIQRYVFLDDLCGSGQQGEQYCADIVEPLKKAQPTAEVIYHVLFATSTGLSTLRGLNLFDEVDCVVELDDTFKAFSDTSRFYDGAESPFDKAVGKDIAHTYGRKLSPSHPLGYRDGQLLLGFSHNVPDNTLPIFWFDERAGPPWYPIFPRYSKRYGWGQETQRATVGANDD